MTLPPVSDNREANDDSAFLTAMILLTYAIVFVGNGQITIPLFLVIPEVLANIDEAKAFILIPTIMGTLGFIMLGCRFIPSEQQAIRYIVITGKVLLGISLIFFAGISEAGTMSIITAVPFFMIAYRSLNKKNDA